VRTGLAGVEEGAAAAAQDEQDVEVASAVAAVRPDQAQSRGSRGDGAQHEGFAGVLGGEPAHGLEGTARAGAQEAVVADLLESTRQDVLEEAAQELTGSSGRERQRLEPLFR
jgi:hypothetical protein